MAHLYNAAANIEKLGRQLASEVELANWSEAAESIHEILSIASKLHQRLSVMTEVFENGVHYASVDRALKKSD